MIKELTETDLELAKKMGISPEYMQRIRAEGADNTEQDRKLTEYLQAKFSDINSELHTLGLPREKALIEMIMIASGLVTMLLAGATPNDDKIPAIKMILERMFEKAHESSLGVLTDPTMVKLAREKMARDLA